MGRRTIGTLGQRLRERGLVATTPVVVVTDVSRRDQHVLRMQLRDLAQGALPADSDAPTLIMIGRAFAQRENVETAFSVVSRRHPELQALAS